MEWKSLHGLFDHIEADRIKSISVASIKPFEMFFVASDI